MNRRIHIGSLHCVLWCAIIFNASLNIFSSSWQFIFKRVLIVRQAYCIFEHRIASTLDYRSGFFAINIFWPYKALRQLFIYSYDQGDMEFWVNSL